MLRALDLIKEVEFFRREKNFNHAVNTPIADRYNLK